MDKKGGEGEREGEEGGEGAGWGKGGRSICVTTIRASLARVVQLLVKAGRSDKLSHAVNYITLPAIISISLPSAVGVTCLPEGARDKADSEREIGMK